VRSEPAVILTQRRTCGATDPTWGFPRSRPWRPRIRAAVRRDEDLVGFLCPWGSRGQALLRGSRRRSL